MEKTARAKSLLVLAAILFAVGYAFSTAAPAILAALLLGYLAYANARFRLLLDQAQVEADGRTIDGVIYKDEPLRVDREVFLHPPGLRVTVDLPESEDYVVEEVEQAREADTREGTLLTVTARIRSTRRGRIEQEGLVLDLRDPDGLFRHEVQVRAPLEFTAHAPRGAFRRSRHARRLRSLLQPRRREPGDWSTSILTHRPYEPGDRPRDVDWKASSRFEDLLVRVYPKEVERPLILVVDASRTMRYRGARGSMLDHASEIAAHLVTVANRGGTPSGFLAHDEHTLLSVVPPARERSLPQRVADAIADLPDPIPLPGETRERVLPGAPEPPAGAPSHRGSDGGGDRLAAQRKLAPFLGGRHRIPHGLTEALSRAASLASTPANIVLVSDLRTPPDRLLRAVHRAQKGQHRVVVASTFTPYFHLAPSEVTSSLVEDVYEARERHERVTRRLEGLAADVIDLAPDTSVRRVLQAVADGTSSESREAPIGEASG